MRQVLFWLPHWLPYPLHDMPIYGFGVMLFLAFVVCTWLAARRAKSEGIAPELIQDLAVWIFVGGIIGARINFMIQYQVPLAQFYRIWEGGLVFYGSAVGGVIGYLLAYWFMLRKLRVSSWQIADIVAPSVAIGLCLGRVGCLLNGCCYGNVACPECAAISFPLSAPPRYELVKDGLQTAAGFSTLPPARTIQFGMPQPQGTPTWMPPPDDPQTTVVEVLPDSPAARAGLQAHDRIVGVEGQPNYRVLLISEHAGNVDVLAQFDRAVADLGGDTVADTAGARRYRFQDYPAFHQALMLAQARRLEYSVHDELSNLLVVHWPRGKTSLQLTVRHADGQEVALPAFVPETIGLHPTQIYESISMVLLFFLLTAFYPLRPARGAVMILLMVGYAVHRFIDEALRNDTPPVVSWPAPMTFSQVGSIVLLVAAVALGAILWYQTKGQKKVAAAELVGAAR